MHTAYALQVKHIHAMYGVYLPKRKSYHKIVQRLFSSILAQLGRREMRIHHEATEADCSW